MDEEREERKVLLIKMKSWEDKRVTLQARAMLKGSMIFMEDDLTRKERETQSKLLVIRKELKEKGEGEKIWVRNGKMAVNGKWYSLEEAESKFRTKEGKGEEK